MSLSPYQPIMVHDLQYLKKMSQLVEEHLSSKRFALMGSGSVRIQRSQDLGRAFWERQEGWGGAQRKRESRRSREWERWKVWQESLMK